MLDIRGQVEILGGVDVGSTGGTHSTANICQPHKRGEHKAVEHRIPPINRSSKLPQFDLPRNWGHRCRSLSLGHLIKTSDGDFRGFSTLAVGGIKVQHRAEQRRCGTPLQRGVSDVLMVGYGMVLMNFFMFWKVAIKAFISDS